MVFATYLDLVKQYDVAVIGQLASDDNTPITETQLAANRYVLRALDRASADIRMACQPALRYTDQNLADIYASTDASISSQIICLCCALAMGYLIDRRVYQRSQFKDLMPGIDEAKGMLVALRNGERIFTLPGVEDAGASVDVVPVHATALQSIVQSLPRYFPAGLPAGKNQFGNYY